MKFAPEKCRLLFFFQFAAAVCVPAWAKACDDFGYGVAIEKINAQRGAFNQAIAEKNIKAIAFVLHKNVILITGTDSEVFEGRYAAKWQLESEVFATEACGGIFCPDIAGAKP